MKLEMFYSSLDRVDTIIWSQKKYVEFSDYLYVVYTDFYMNKLA